MPVFAPYVCFHILVRFCVLESSRIFVLEPYVRFHIFFLFLTAPFPDHCLLVPFGNGVATL